MVAIKFNSSKNLLRVDVDKPPPIKEGQRWHDGFSIISSTLVEHVFEVEINQYTGALLAFELHIVPWDSDWWKNADDRALIEYDSQSDNLSVKFTTEGVARSFDAEVAVLSDDSLEIPDMIRDYGLCDLVWKDDDAMISLSRNEVGNLIGIDILGLEDIIHKFNC